MPYRDGTGPFGTGGRCTPLLRSGQMAAPMGGFGRGRGMGRCMSPFRTAPAAGKEEEIRLLEEQAEAIKRRLEELKK